MTYRHGSPLTRFSPSFRLEPEEDQVSGASPLLLLPLGVSFDPFARIHCWDNKKSRFAAWIVPPAGDAPVRVFVTQPLISIHVGNSPHCPKSTDIVCFPIGKQCRPILARLLPLLRR